MTQALKPTANTTAVKSMKLVETGKLLKFLYEQSLARSLNSVLAVEVTRKFRDKIGWRRFWLARTVSSEHGFLGN